MDQNHDTPSGHQQSVCDVKTFNVSFFITALIDRRADKMIHKYPIPNFVCGGIFIVNDQTHRVKKFKTDLMNYKLTIQPPSDKETLWFTFNMMTVEIIKYTLEILAGKLRLVKIMAYYTKSLTTRLQSSQIL